MSQSKINQHHSGSGDNVAGNKTVNNYYPQDSLSPATAKKSSFEVDVLIIVALKDEFDALMEVTSGLDTWQAVKKDNFTRYYKKEIEREQGSRLKVAAMWGQDMGTTQAAILATDLAKELNPQCLAMCGICAGRPGDVFLGDVIVADRVFPYDKGKMKNEEGQKILYRDMKTYNLKPKFKTAVEEIQKQWKPDFVEERSYSIDYQSQWLLRGIAAVEAGEIDTLPDFQPLNQYVKNRQGALERLRAKGWVEKQDFKLTEEGRKYYANEQFFSPDAPPPEADFQVHLGPVGTGTQVVQDGSIWNELAIAQRKIIGLEMEGEAIGIVSEIQEIDYMIFVKGVCDYADKYKDDSFREFAAKASASFLIDFLKKYLPQKKK